MAVKRLYNESTNRKENISGSLCNTTNMCTFIKMEYLVANALVELYEKKKIDRISLEQIRNYGIKVEEELNSKDNTRAILLYSNNYTKEFLRDYSDFFEMIDSDIRIREGITIKDIREHILSYVSVNLLFALLDKKTLSVIDAA